MTVLRGRITKIVPERKYVYITNEETGEDIWMHHSNFVGSPSAIVQGVHVEYTILDYLDRKQIARQKAVGVRTVNPEIPYETQPIVPAGAAPAPVVSAPIKPAPEPMPVKVVAHSAPNPTAGRAIAARSLSFNHARVKSASTPQGKALLQSDEQNLRLRGSKPKHAPTDSSSGE